MRARSALFDLYGDYLSARGGRAPVASLIKLLTPVGIAAPAVRTAVSRMVREGWLEPLRLDGGPGYAMTPKAARWLDNTTSRPHRHTADAWPGRFDLLLLDLPASRPIRPQLCTRLAELGYGRLDDRAWIAPWSGEKIDHVLATAKINFYRFQVTSEGRDDPALVRRAWDLPALATAYQRFMAELAPVVEQVTGHEDDRAAFRARFLLVHAWRSCQSRDPRLPLVLLPEPWPGTVAAAFFQQHAAALQAAADRFVENCLDL